MRCNEAFHYAEVTNRGGNAVLARDGALAVRPIFRTHRRWRIAHPISDVSLTLPENIMKDDTNIYPLALYLTKGIGDVSSQEQCAHQTESGS